MFLAFFIFTRILFIACMVFVIGHIFGNFSKNRTLRRITRIAAILAIVLFFATNAFVIRGGWSSYHHDWQYQEWCYPYHNDNKKADFGFSGKRSDFNFPNSTKKNPKIICVVK